jgi:putative ABC transport system permease protein
MFRFALGNLLSRPVRSALSILGLTVAIAGMVGLFSIRGGIDNLVAITFEQIPGLLVQQRGAPVPLFSTLPAAWQAEIEELEGVSVVNPEILARVNVINGKNIISPPRFLLGVDIQSRLRLKRGVYDEHLEQGRFLEPGDEGTFNCVVARQIAEEFGKTVGDTLRVNGHDMTIVGTYYCGTMLLDVSILLDIDVVRQITRYDPGSVSCYYVETTGQFDDATMCDRIEQQFAGRTIIGGLPFFLEFGLPATSGDSENPLTKLFRNLDRGAKGTPSPTASSEGDHSATEPPSNHGPRTTDLSNPKSLPHPPDSPVEVRSADDWAAAFDEFSADLDLFLSLMTAIGLIVAVLSIVNTMLMSVTERRIEFGILRANGWSRAHIVRLITFESGLLGIAGGLLGALFGWLATHVINWTFPDRAHLHAGIGLIVFSLVFSTCLGILGGVYPAWLAARLSPMEAIRRG